MAATIQASNLTKVYNPAQRPPDERVYALNDVSLEIQPGEMVAIVGGPGSGKSTFLHILACLQRPDSGQMLIDGLDVAQFGDDELARVRVRKVGFIFQAFNVLPDESVLANVEVPLRHLDLEDSVRRQKAEEALQFVGLGNCLDHKPGQLSATQRQCVAIARALVHEPAVIIADEPTRALDSTSQEEVMGLFQRINDDGKTILISTPDSTVASYCRRTVMLAEGRIVDDRPVSDRRIVPPSTVTRPPADIEVEEEEVVCPRCNHGNAKDKETCQHCTFPLRLTPEERETIESRLSGIASRWLGVESPLDEGEVPGYDAIEELKEVPVFSGLGPKSLAKIMPALEGRLFPRNSTITKQGDVADAFYIIRKGNVQVVLEREGGQTVSIARLGRMEGFGEMALMADQPRSASVIALTDVEVWCLPKATFQALLSENLSLSLYFNRILAERLIAIQASVEPAA